MLEVIDCGCLLISATSLLVATRAKRKQVVLFREVDTVAQQLRTIASRLESLPADSVVDGVARVRHDLLTPLSSVMGFCALLKETSDGLSPKQERMLNNIDAGARQMLELVGASSKDDR